MKNAREKIVVKTSLISIATNILLVVSKAIVGLMANSIAIISDAVNNLSDALSSIVTIIGTKLSGKAPDREHPYGYGRGEYITSLIVSAIVLYAGVTALIESGKKIFEPEPTDYSAATIIVLIIGVVGKIVLGLYVKKTGKKINSGALVASGTDAFNDAILSASVLASAVIYMIWGISLEAYVGVIVAIYIIKTGIDLIKEAVDSMLGTRVESDLSKKIKKEVLKEKLVEGAYDLILTDYGPDTYLGSIHIEVPDTLTVAEVDQISRRLTKAIIKKYGVILHTIGVYSINTKDKQVIKMRAEVEKIVFSHKGVLQMHGFYVNKGEKTISFDIIIDFNEKNREELYRHIYDEVQEKYPEYKLEMTLDIDAS